MTAIIGTLRLTAASTKQLVRSGEVYGDVFLYPGLLLGLLWLFSDLRMVTSAGAISLMDLWVTGAAVLAVALGNGHAFLALIATYKSSGALKRISVTPISPGQLIVSEVVPRAAQGAIIFVFFLAAGRALGANVRIEPGIVSLIPIVVLVTATGLSIPFIIAGLTKTPADANAIDAYAGFPVVLFTGAFFPLAAFPAWIQDVAQFIPYTSLIAATRGVVLDGLPLTDFGRELAIGVGWVAVLSMLAARAYRFVK